MFFKMRAGGTVYQIDKLTLGDTRTLKHKFGLTDLEEFSSTDPDVIVGLLAIAIQKQDGVTIDAATLTAEAMDFESLAPAEDEKEPVADAAPLADAAATVAPQPVTEPETIPPTPGTPS